MPQVIWKGNISFGLITIPVVLQAAEKRDELDFRLLDRRDLSPIGYRKVNKQTGEEVPAQEIVKGYEYEEGRFVILEEEELRNADPERTQTVEIVAFVDVKEIDPVFFDRPYYLEPAGKHPKAFVVLRDALRKSGKAGIAKVVIRTREYVAAVLAWRSILVLNLLRYGSELRDPAQLEVDSTVKDVRATEKEINLAERLIEEMTEKWQPQKFRDEYRKEVLDLIQKKAKTGKIEAVKEAKAAGRGEIIDIMELLKRSVEQKEKERRRAKTA